MTWICYAHHQPICSWILCFFTRFSSLNFRSFNKLRKELLIFNYWKYSIRNTTLLNFENLSHFLIKFTIACYQDDDFPSIAKWLLNCQCPARVPVNKCMTCRFLLYNRISRLAWGSQQILWSVDSLPSFVIRLHGSINSFNILRSDFDVRPRTEPSL